MDTQEDKSVKRSAELSQKFMIVSQNGHFQVHFGDIPWLDLSLETEMVKSILRL